jgi:pyridoxal phosphate enzyme (YggS family)
MAEPVTQAVVARAVAEVRQRIGEACVRSGRPSVLVTLVGVTKFQPLERVQAAVQCGLHDLGENRAQDLARRIASLEAAGAVAWHFLGPLQRNKTRVVAELATAFHALDRVEIAERLAAQRPEHLPPLDVYIEVNIAGEGSKAGVAPTEAARLVDAARAFDRLRVVGLMAMPPAVSFAPENRRWFAALRELAEQVGVDGLSMGTSADFDVAVEEGATAVRVGRQLFGAR